MAKKEFKVALGELLLIEMPDYGNFSARVQNIEGNTIWTQYYLNNYLNNIDYHGRIVHIKCYNGGNYYVFDAVTEKNEMLDGLLMCKLTRVTDIEIIQRRNSCRVQILIDVTAKVKNTDDEPFTCKAVDVSETGIALNTKKIIVRNMTLELHFSIENVDYSFEALVVRVTVTKTTSGIEIKKIGLRYLSPEKNQLKDLRRFIFKQQIKSRVVN